jgi:hypothetical protein
MLPARHFLKKRVGDRLHDGIDFAMFDHLGIGVMNSLDVCHALDMN